MILKVVKEELKGYGCTTFLNFLLSVVLISVLFIQPTYTSSVNVTTTTETSLNTIIMATIGEPYTVDPAWAYDATSCELVFNVYEPLVSYAVNRSFPPALAGRVDQLVPCLATNWTISQDGKTYTFEIREGVKFHNNETLTTEDVEYSFERAMVHDASGSPVWMLYEALLGCWHANLSDPHWHLKIENAVEHNATHVWFNLKAPYAPFIQILCQSWSSIVNKKFCVEHGDWPANETAGKWFWSGGNWTQYHKPTASPLDTGGDWMCGTGPYKLDYWTHGVEYSIVKFDDYWQGWPAPDCDGYVRRVIVKKIPEWITRREMLLNGTADVVYVPRQYIEDVECQPGIRCVKDLPVLSCSAFFFTFNISTTNALGWPNPWMGVPGGLPPGTINETGIPPDFFNDTYVRKGFAYSFNWTKYIEEVYQGEATQPATPVIEGLPYRNPAQEKYYLNLTEAEDCFKRAWDGQVWEKGFTMTLVYPESSVPRFHWIDILKENVESLNPKFHINKQGMGRYYILENLVHSALPMFHLGFLGDYPDPHNFIYDFMHSNGAFSHYQRYSNETVDTLIQEGLETQNTTRRREIYYELQNIYHKECSSVPTAQPLGRHWQRTWIRGWYYNPAYPGNYFYHLWKEGYTIVEIVYTSEFIIPEAQIKIRRITFKWKGEIRRIYDIIPLYH